VAQFDAATPIPVERLANAINSRLPEDIEIIRAELAEPDFDAISQAKSKQYRYRVFNALRRPVHLRHYVHHCWWALDLRKMTQAAQRLLGEHDFAGFSAADHNRLTTIRTVHDCRVEVVDVPKVQSPESRVREGEAPAEPRMSESSGCESQVTSHKSQVAGVEGEREIQIVVSGSGFLYNMVRIIAGTLLEVGRGAMPPEKVDEILATGNRQLAGPTLPPQGLWLEWIRYGESAIR
jgi:tRNA pseudouridine38-40 synthase